jgi:hypothetical protein
MDRALAWIVYAYFGLAVLHWRSVAELVHERGLNSFPVSALQTTGQSVRINHS